nr:LLM class flavin-dependent oxidoreductase [Sphingobium boeckii]
MELGIYTFGDIVPDPFTGHAPDQTERMAQLIALGRLADELGLDVFGVGEHHTQDFVVSATATVLAAVAAVTTRIRLTSASTLISTADPVRTFQEFATLDLVSRGRAELVFGRGAFTENFALFGHDQRDYDALFTEKIGLFEALNASGRVTWKGRFRSALSDAVIAPRPSQTRLPVSIGALSAGSIVRAARLGLSLAMPLLGGTLAGYAELARLYRHTWAEAGHDPEAARIAGYSHLHVAETSRAARDDFYPYYTAYFAHLSGRGGIPRASFDAMAAPDGVLFTGSSQEVIDRILRLREATGMTRYIGQIDIGGQSHAAIARGLERFALEVAPVIRRESAGADRHAAA